jgi:amino acid transporter
MSATTGEPTDAPLATMPQLRNGTLSQFESLGQSVANIAPTLTPALNISVVAAIAGTGSWLAYVVATVGMLFVSANIGALARRHPESGSYFLYIGRNFGPLAGALSGWSMIAAYLFTAVAVSLAFTLFLQNVFDAFGLGSFTPPGWLVVTAFLGIVWYAGYRDIKLSSRLALVLEGISLSIIVLITVLVVVHRGTVVDPVQLTITQLPFGGVTAALAFAVFSFVGFESAATLAKETHDAHRAVPRAIMLSAGLSGLFFIVVTYFMVLGMDDDAAAIGKSGAPFTDLTTHVGIGSVAGIVYFSALISGFACALASINAASRLIFSMGKYQFLSGSMGRIHETHRTPHFAVTLVCVFSLVVTLAMLPLGALDAFGYTGTFATFGFLLVYLLVCMVAPVDLRRGGSLLPRQVASAVIGVLLMLFVMFGSIYPVPDWPLNLIPYLFAAYMMIGALWFGTMKMRKPELLMMIEHDLEV